MLIGIIFLILAGLTAGISIVLAAIQKMMFSFLFVILFSICFFVGLSLTRDAVNSNVIENSKFKTITFQIKFPVECSVDEQKDFLLYYFEQIDGLKYDNPLLEYGMGECKITNLKIQ